MEENYRKMWLMEVKHGHEQCSHIIELEQVLDACEINNAQHLKHIMALEQLCRDMYTLAKAGGLDGRCTNPEGEDCHTPCDDCLYYSDPIHDRMEQLGLI